MAHRTDESPVATSVLPPYTDRPLDAPAAGWSRVYVAGSPESDAALTAERQSGADSQFMTREPHVPSARGLKNIGDGNDCLPGVHWSSDSWATRAARRQESVPPVPVDGDKERVMAWWVPAW